MAKFTPGTITGFGGSITMTWKPHPNVVAGEIMNIANALENTTSPLLEAKRIAQADMRMKFDTETDPDGVPWKEWTEKYAGTARRVNKGGILQRTLAMRGAAEDGYYVRPDSLWWSMSEPFYWLFHELGAGHKGEVPEEVIYGTGAIGANLPQRRFASITADAQIKIITAFKLWFEGAVSFHARTGVRGPGGRFISPNA